MLVDLALELGVTRALDVGTGSGAIALAVADELEDARVTAIDTSFDAVRLAQANTERLGLTDRVDVVLRGPSSLGGAEPGGHPFDLLLANLPYVSEDEWEDLAPEIREFEPREALVAGPTGLEAIEALADELFGLAPRPSVVALEVGAGQAEAVSRLIRAAGYEEVEIRRDLGGHERVVIGR
jgi:release factor glutamine methyltransferase